MRTIETMELTDFSISRIRQGLLKKEFSALELAKAFLDKIEKENKKIFAVLTVCKDSALLQAKRIDELIAAGHSLPLLAGIPCLIKDNILAEGVQCTAGSKILENYVAPYDATVVKLLKNQGVVILGKTNLDEFAVGSSGEYSGFGSTLNPRDLTRVPGGSSSGSSAAVASRFCSFSLGSDTGGSIRLPASFCGVIGFKPTYGAVSRYGLIAMSSSLDQIGPLANSVEDVRAVFRAISGKDSLDSTSIGFLDDQKSKPKGRKIKIGIPKEYFIKGIDPFVEKKIREAIKKIEGLGMEVAEISLPHTKYSLAAYYIIMPSELSANLARYDGIRYGYSAAKEKETDALLDVYLKTRMSGFGKEVRRRILLGAHVLSAGHYEAYYLRAQKVRTLISEDFSRAFKDVDVILTPTSPVLPFKLGERISDPLSMYLSDIFTVAVNLAGLPAISIPVGEVDGLPVGAQIIGKKKDDYEVISAAQILEEVLSIEK